MATVPNPTAWVAGERPTAAKLNANSTDLGNFLLSKPTARIENWTDQAVPTATYTDLTFSTTAFDTDGMASLVNNRIIIQTNGIYRINCQTAWNVSGVGIRYAALLKNGSYVTINGYPPHTAGLVVADVNEMLYLVAGDYLTVRGYQNTGGSLSTYSSTGTRPSTYLQVEWVSR